MGNIKILIALSCLLSVCISDCVHDEFIKNTTVHYYNDLTDKRLLQATGPGRMRIFMDYTQVTAGTALEKGYIRRMMNITANFFYNLLTVDRLGTLYFPTGTSQQCTIILTQAMSYEFQTSTLPREQSAMWEWWSAAKMWRPTTWQSQPPAHSWHPTSGPSGEPSFGTPTPSNTTTRASSKCCTWGYTKWPTFWHFRPSCTTPTPLVQCSAPPLPATTTWTAPIWPTKSRVTSVVPVPMGSTWRIKMAPSSARTGRNIMSETSSWLPPTKSILMWADSRWQFSHRQGGTRRWTSRWPSPWPGAKTEAAISSTSTTAISHNTATMHPFLATGMLLESENAASTYLLDLVQSLSTSTTPSALMRTTRSTTSTPTCSPKKGEGTLLAVTLPITGRRDFWPTLSATGAMWLCVQSLARCSTFWSAATR